MRVDEYVLLGRTAHLGPFGYEGPRDLETAGRALARLDLGPLSRRRLQTLSGGEQQRVVLCRALAQEAPLLLLDEPTTSLDIGRQQQALELVATLRETRRADGRLRDARHHARRAVRRPAARALGRAARRRRARLRRSRHAELIAEHYGAEVRVVGEGGSLAVIPVRRK